MASTPLMMSAARAATPVIASAATAAVGAPALLATATALAGVAVVGVLVSDEEKIKKKAEEAIDVGLDVLMWVAKQQLRKQWLS
eukprot:COSAG06_NODE_1161_length_10460_cov_27.510086_7_plen_84_part_00